MKKPIAQRIREAFKKGEYELSYHALMYRVFPPEEYPNAYRYSCNGGPPGCAMAFRKALNRLEMRGHYKGRSEYFFPPKEIDQ